MQSATPPHAVLEPPRARASPLPNPLGRTLRRSRQLASTTSSLADAAGSADTTAPTVWEQTYAGVLNPEPGHDASDRPGANLRRLLNPEPTVEVSSGKAPVTIDPYQDRGQESRRRPPPAVPGADLPA